MNQYDRLVATPYGTHRGMIRSFLGEFEYRTGRLHEYTCPDFYSVKRVVFTCLGNICRSAFAEAVSHTHGLSAVSLGLSTTTGAPAAPEALEAAKRRGIDLSRHRATDWNDFTVSEGDLLVAMEVRHARRLFELTRGIGSQVALLGLWSRPRRVHIHDPLTLSPNYFDTCFGVIGSGVKGLAEKIVSNNGPATCHDDSGRR